MFSVSHYWQLSEATNYPQMLGFCLLVLDPGHANALGPQNSAVPAARFWGTLCPAALSASSPAAWLAAIVRRASPHNSLQRPSFFLSFCRPAAFLPMLGRPTPGRSMGLILAHLPKITGKHFPLRFKNLSLKRCNGLGEMCAEGEGVSCWKGDCFPQDLLCSCAGAPVSSHLK